MLGCPANSQFVENASFFLLSWVDKWVTKKSNTELTIPKDATIINYSLMLGQRRPHFEASKNPSFLKEEKTMAKFRFQFVDGTVVHGGAGAGRPLHLTGCISEARDGFKEVNGHSGVFAPVKAVTAVHKAPTAMYTITVDRSVQFDGNRGVGKPKKGYVLQRDSLVIDGIELKGSIVRRELCDAPVVA